MSKAADAQQLLDNPIFQEIFGNVREGLVQAIEDCPIDNDKKRNQLMLSLQLLRELKGEVEVIISDGLMEESE